MTREEAWNRIDAIIARYEIDNEYVTITSILDYDALGMARKALEQEPNTGHSEPFINKPCISQEVCREDRVRVLDKIKSEIKEYNSRQLALAIGVKDLEKGRQVALEYVLAIIDKYREESDDEE